jgi:phosphate-selective porin OprO/OprP
MYRITLLFAALLALATAAAAQIGGLYYHEIEKDGRIYVFNTPERQQLFESSGDMGVAITLIGKGPGGKTVVVENETAADLFFFRHNLPGYARPTPKPATPAFTVGWKDGKTSITSKSADLKISNRVQVRWTNVDPEVGDERGDFRIRRAKTKFEGWVYTKKLTYELQMNWADTSNALEDAVVNYDFKGDKSIQLKAGQFKVPFGRQELTSSGSQQFVDRATVSNTFALGRDIGVQLHGLAAGGKIDWRVGAFNGAGRNRSTNDNDEYQYNARVSFEPFGEVKYSEGDFDSTDRPLFGLALQYQSNDKHGASTADDLDQEIVGGDLTFKFKGFSVFVDYYDATNAPEIAGDFDSEGITFQAGYFVIPQKLELAVRYSVYDPTSLVDNDDRIEQGLAFGYFWNKHNHKLQADFRELENERTDIKDRELRVQYQIIF